MSNDNHDTIGFTTIVVAKIPSDPDELSRFHFALQAVGNMFPADDIEPLRSDVLAEACEQLNRVSLSRFDRDDGTDYAECLVDAYLAARAKYLAQAPNVIGNA